VSEVRADPRFARFSLIDWWDQDRVANARVVVVGAGALGNEVIKNLALVGIRNLVIIDMDAIDSTNLSRSVLFRREDEGEPKAVVASRSATGLYPGLVPQALVQNVVHDVGAGWFRSADVVIGALDNREARFHVNRLCFLVGTPWIDGAIETLSGVARVFSPRGGACYECTMGEADWQVLEQRRSCSLLNRRIVEAGHVPTTPTMASVIGGIQCQEALKLLHGMPTLQGAGLVFDGVHHQTFRVEYTANRECPNHEALGTLTDLEGSASSTTVETLLDSVRSVMGRGATVELVRELLCALECPDCGGSEELMRPLSAVTEADGECPDCGARRVPRLFHTLDGTEPFKDRTLAAIGVPPWDVVIGRRGEERHGFALAAEGAVGPGGTHG
jgi:molybdopterin/thiamine biosynthesis adenylyltransferase